MKNIDLLLKENAHILNRRVYFQKNKIIIALYFNYIIK